MSFAFGNCVHMRVRVLKFIAIAVTALLLLDLALFAPALWSASHRSEIPFHDTYVEDLFGLPWWVVPTVLLLAILMLFICSRRVATSARGAEPIAPANR